MLFTALSLSSASARILNDCGREGESEAAAIRALGNFRGVELGDWFVARTGYTGEKGLEVILPAEQAPQLWEALLTGGVKPIGLGARDTLRLEAWHESLRTRHGRDRIAAVGKHGFFDRMGAK